MLELCEHLRDTTGLSDLPLVDQYSENFLLFFLKFQSRQAFNWTQFLQWKQSVGQQEGGGIVMRNGYHSFVDLVAFLAGSTE